MMFKHPDHLLVESRERIRMMQQDVNHQRLVNSAQKLHRPFLLKRMLVLMLTVITHWMNVLR